MQNWKIVNGVLLEGYEEKKKTTSWPEGVVNKVVCGDCLEVMKGIPDNSIDAILTDPPYGLVFMGKDWDKGIPKKPFWEEMLRIAKPGSEKADRHHEDYDRPLEIRWLCRKCHIEEHAEQLGSWGKGLRVKI